MNEWALYELRDIGDEEKRAQLCNIGIGEIRSDVKAVMLAQPLETAELKAQQRYDAGNWHIKTNMGKLATNLWPYTDVGHTDEAKKELKGIFNGVAPIETPKPARLIERILQIAGDKETLILDSFAGSGTTAHAVLNMNKADGGNRKFILIEMEDYAERITAERVRRVINGYGVGKSAVEGTGGDFSFYELGEPLLIGDNLNEAVGVEKIREYIWYTETKASFTPQSGGYYLGKHGDTGYYFYYEPDRITSLDHAFLSQVREKASGYVIYADRCALSDAELSEYGVKFKKIPRDITKI